MLNTKPLQPELGLLMSSYEIIFVFTGYLGLTFQWIKMNSELRQVLEKLLNCSEFDKRDVMENTVKLEINQPSESTPQPMLEPTPMEDWPQISQNPLEQGIVKNPTVNQEQVQIDLDLQANKLTSNDELETLENPSPSSSQNTFYRKDDL